MKYMGSKSYMLRNGLGTLIKKQASKSKRIVDLFSGAANISWFAAEKTNKPVTAIDIQNYSKVLADAVLLRKQIYNADQLINHWVDPTKTKLQSSDHFIAAQAFNQGKTTRKNVKAARKFCEDNKQVGLIWRTYGGHYFSPSQALTFDLLRCNLPKSNPTRSLCLAALITAASKCAASPGHTAQPFQPTKRAKKFIQESWQKDPIQLTEEALKEISSRHANKIGKARVADALKYANKLKENDLVIIDPPYSGVQYSRFYHVLETIATGKCGAVSGVGRYPSIKERPQSPFSNKSQSKDALEKLLLRIASRGAKVIFTFPAGEASNGLSGKLIESTANKWFKVSKNVIKNRFSTLGGNNNNRDARQQSKELILLLTPKMKSKD